MNLFGIFNKEKAVPFPQFREMVRQAIRKAEPQAKIEATENGFTLVVEDMPVACNLRNLYAAYSKAPVDRDVLIKQWMDTLVTKVPEHSWSEARMLLRPTLKSAAYIASAKTQMLKSTDPDSLPAYPFVGELFVIAVREYAGTLTAVTQKQLDGWGVPIEEVMREAVNNMNMMNMPPVSNELLLGGSSRKGEGTVVGLDFQGDHLTATWLISERFRDHVGMRLQTDYVVSTPNRGRLIAVRADEPGLIASIQSGNRNFERQPYALTGQCYHVNTGTTGGVVTVYKGSQADALDPNSLFAGGKPAEPAPAAPAASRKGTLTDFSQWGLTESTGDSGPSETTPWNR